MISLFSRRRKAGTADALALAALGRELVALRLDAGAPAPALKAAPDGCCAVIVGAGGHTRRSAIPAGTAKLILADGDTVFCFHPGPYSVDLVPFAAAPELGLRLRFIIDAANPRVAQQRFDLFLSSEAGARLELAGLGAGIEAALRLELVQGRLDLPPCTSLDEWNVFRAGLNQLLYVRFGVTVDDCVPVDLGERVDFAQLLRERASAAAAALIAHRVSKPVPSALATVAGAVAGSAVHAAASTAAVAAASDVAAAGDANVGTVCANDAAAAGITISQAAPRRDGLRQNASAPAETVETAAADARALRRLFLELPALASGIRMLELPPGLAPFQAQQSLLQRFSLLCLGAGGMPSLAWEAPDRPLPAALQARRARHAVAAAATLDEGWALLARWQLAASDGDQARWPAWLDEAERVCANLEQQLALRRAPRPDLPGQPESPDQPDQPESPGQSSLTAGVAQRKEPSL